MSKNFSVKKIKPYKGFKKRVQDKPNKKKRIFVASLFLLVAVCLLIFNIFSNLKIIIVPETKNVEKNFDAQLNTEVIKIEKDPLVLPAKVFSLSKKISGKFKATGEKDMGTKASGIVTFFNATGRSQPLTKKNELIDGQGKIFLLKQNITIPSAKVDENGNIVAGQLSAEIEAKDPGDTGNVGAGRINIVALDIDRQSKVYGQIEDKISGGKSKMVTVVSQEDLDKAKDSLFKEVEYDLRDDIEKEAGNDQSVVDELIEYDDSQFSSDIELDNEAENFEASLDLKAKALVYNNQQLKTFLKQEVLDGLEDNQIISEKESGDLKIEVEKMDIDRGLAKLKIKVKFPVSEGINLDEVKKNILGMSEQEARRYILSLPNIKNVKFDFSFSLGAKVPKKEDKIDIRMGEL